MLFYNNLCLSSVSNATLVIFLLNCFYSIINNTYPLSVKLVSKQFNGFCHSPQDFHLCIIQCSRTHCVRRSERSNCGCTGVSLSDRAVHGDKRGQVFYKNTDRLSLAFAGERSWRICFNGSLSVKGIELLYSVVKEHERRKSSFLYTALEKSRSVTNIQNFFLFLYHIGKESVILLS